MSRIAYVNGQYVPYAQAGVHVEDRGFQFADGVYEVVAVKDGGFVDLEGHLVRLERSLDELRIDRPMSRAALSVVLAETVRRTTGRVVLDPKQANLDPGISVSGQLHKMGYDAAEQAVIVRYDAAMSTAGGTRVETRRFEAKVPTSDDAPNVGAALNQAANQVALEAATWIGR